MAMDHNASGRRPHYHRGRRGMDRRGSERRSQQPAEAAPRPSSDQLDVEQIMREIRSRIAQRGIDLTPQQIQDLAAHRLEAILDPRNINPTLLDQLRRGAATPPDPLPRGPPRVLSRIRPTRGRGRRRSRTSRRRPKPHP